MSQRRVLVGLASAALALAYAANAARAGYDARPYNVDGKIATGGFDDGTSDFVPVDTVFGYTLGSDDPDQPFFTQDPGFNAAAGSGLTAGATMAFDILGPTSGSVLPFDLSYWDGTGAVSWSSVPNGESLNFDLGAHSVTFASTTSLIAGFNLQTLTSMGAMHQHLGASLLGSDGNAVPAGPGNWGPGDGIQATAGIYALSLQLRDGVEQNSAPIYILYGARLRPSDDLPQSDRAGRVGHRPPHRRRGPRLAIRAETGRS